LTRSAPNFLLGYHGCDYATAQAIISNGQQFLTSEKDYDWLGPGTYFWENDPLRALEWAQERTKAGKTKDAFVIGAIIDVGNCLDLTIRENLELLTNAYAMLAEEYKSSEKQMPENKDPISSAGDDKLLRYLDCAVIRYLHLMHDDDPKLDPFDTVRGMFPEGPPAYPGAGFHAKTHTQIAVINPRAIVEVFTPRALIKSHGMKLPPAA
jgi:hypothetical protein